MTTIKLKNGSGAPTSGDLVQGEPALDLTNKRLYTEDSGGTVIEVGTNPGVDVTFADNRKAIFGAGSDLSIYHDGSDSYIREFGAGDLKIQAINVQIENSSGVRMFKGVSAGEAILYHNNAQKLATTSTGIDVTGVITTDGMTTSADINFGDNDKALFGAGSDLQIFHNGTDSYISDTGTGDLNIKGSNNIYLLSGASELYAQFTTDGAATLYYDNAAKIATTSTGIDVTGTVTADGLTVTGTNANLTLGTSGNDITFNRNADNYINASGGTSSNIIINPQNRFVVNTAGAERMRIDSSGRVGIGTSSIGSSTKLQVAGRGLFTDGLPDPADGSPAGVAIGYNTTSGYGFVQAIQTGVANKDLYLQPSGANNVIIANSGGNVGIGTSSPSQALHVAGAGSMMLNESTSWSYLRLKSPSANGGYIQFADAEDDDVGQIFYYHGAGGNYMSFTTNASEAMRIDASGNLLVGTTSTANIANATPNVVTDQSYGINDTVNKVAFQVDRISFDSSNYYVLNSSAIGVKLVNGATAWTTQSDETLKENITELTNVLSKVQNLRCVSYNLKSQNSDDVKLGFIAQDWQTDFSQVVNVDPCDGKLGMNYTETIPVLLKAIQEQTEIINDLRARVAQLEGEA